jgi:hypothetical protein
MERIGQLTTKQLTDALLWLAGYAPSVFDVVAEAVEPFPGDGTDDPAPYCLTCSGDIGIFLKFGLDWHHYSGIDLSDIELIDPGHRPVLAWRSQERLPKDAQHRVISPLEPLRSLCARTLQRRLLATCLAICFAACTGRVAARRRIIVDQTVRKAVPFDPR